MRSTVRFILLIFSLYSSSSTASESPNSCVGNFCMLKPLTEKQFVARYGGGGLRHDDDEKELRYRCFYDDATRQWAEFEFSRHEDREPRHLQGVTLGQAEMCSRNYRSQRPMNLKIARGAVAIGMSEKEVAEKMPSPSKIVPLSPRADSRIYDSRFGDHAWIYESDESLLFTAIYFRDGKMVNYRLLYSE